MESVIGRYRNLIILVGVLFLQVLGLAMQVKKSGVDVEKTRLIRIWAVDAVTPFERMLVWVQTSSGNLWHNYFYLRGVRAENRQLKDQIEQMRLQQVRLADGIHFTFTGGNVFAPRIWPFVVRIGRQQMTRTR